MYFPLESLQCSRLTLPDIKVFLMKLNSVKQTFYKVFVQIFYLLIFVTLQRSPFGIKAQSSGRTAEGDAAQRRKKGIGFPHGTHHQ